MGGQKPPQDGLGARWRIHLADLDQADVHRLGQSLLPGQIGGALERDAAKAGHQPGGAGRTARACAQPCESSAPQPSSSASTVTRGLARKRENPTIPLRRPPASRRRQVLVRAPISASNRPPFLPGARLRNRPASSLPKQSPAILHSRKGNRIMQHKTRQAHRGNQT